MPYEPGTVQNASLTLHPCRTHTHTHAPGGRHYSDSRQGSWALERRFPTRGLGTVQSAPSEPSKTNALLWQFGSGLGEVAWPEFLSFDIRLCWMLCVSHSLKKNLWVFHLIPQGSPVRYVLLLSPFYRWENWGTKCPRSLLRSEGAEIEFFLNWKNNVVQFFYLQGNYEIPKRYWSLGLLQKSDMGWRRDFQWMINISFQSHECRLKNTPEI